MRLKQFLYLQTVAECKSITKAAEKLFISHQALSYALQKLEETYKITLLTRTPYGILLTPEGEEFLEVAKQILDMNDYLTKRFDQISNVSDLTGILNIVAPDDYILSIWPNVQRQVERIYPKLQLSIESNDLYSSIRQIENMAKDIGYVSIYALKDADYAALPDKVIYRSLACEDFVAAVSKRNYLWKKNSVSFKNILECPVLFLENSPQTFKDAFIIKNHLRQHKVYFENITVDSEELYYNYLNEENVITVGRRKYLQNIKNLNPNEIVLIPLKEKLVEYTGYMYHEALKEDPRIQAFLQASII